MQPYEVECGEMLAVPVTIYSPIYLDISKAEEMKSSWVCLLALVSRFLVGSVSLSSLLLVSDNRGIPTVGELTLAMPASIPEIDRAIANGEIDKVIPLLKDLRSQAQKAKDTALEVKVLSRLQFAYYCQGAMRKSLVVAQDLSAQIYTLANRDTSNQKLVATIADNVIWYLYAGVERGNSDLTDEVIKEYLENINRAKDSDVKARFYLGLAYAYYLKGNTTLFNKYKQKLEQIYPKVNDLGINADLTLVLALIKFTSATSGNLKDYSSNDRAAVIEREKNNLLATDRITALQQRYEKAYPIVKVFSHINLAAVYFASENYTSASSILANSERNLGQIPSLFRYLTLNYLGDIAVREKRYSQANNYYRSLAKELELGSREKDGFCSDCIPAKLSVILTAKLNRAKYLSGQPLSQQEIFSLVYMSSNRILVADDKITQQLFNDLLGDGIIAQKSLIAQGSIWDAFAASEYTRTQLTRLSLGNTLSIRDDDYVKRSMDMNFHPFKEAFFPNSVWNLASMIQDQNTIQINQKYGNSVHNILGTGRSTIVEYAYNFVEKNPTEIYVYIIKPGMDTRKMKPILRCIPLDLSLASDVCKSYANPKSSLPSQERASINKLGLKEYIQRNLLNIKSSWRGEINRQDGYSSQQTNDSQKTYKSLQSLHQLLIEPIADLLPSDQYEKVIFIPQGDLFSIPFTALQDSQGKYLIEKHTISLAPSLMLLAQATKLYLEESRAQNKGVLVVGNPTMSKQLSLSPLPAAETEAKSIAQIYGVEPLIGDRATKESVLKQLAGARIVHLATHGRLDKNNSLNNNIVLAPTLTNAEGALLAREIPANKAELVILSACDSGRGEVSTDGLGGFATQLLLSGTSSQILTLWAVNDNSTAEIMIDFHRSFREGFSKTHALRFAMLKAIQNKQRTEYAKPYYWAPFVLMGGTQ